MKTLKKVLTAALILTVGSTAYLMNGRGHVNEAQAIIGRPLTPLSFAGVARRSVYRGAAYGAGAAYAGAAVAGAGVGIATLPSGCAQTYLNGSLTYGCGGAYYRPVYQGPNLVYMPYVP